MGLASFNRMRRSRAEVEKIEAERFKIDNAARNGARLYKEEADRMNRELNDRATEAEAAAVALIGEKNLEGMKEGVDDMPLRKDHAAEIAGRNIENVQEPKDPVERIDERIPQHNTANEALTEHMSVDREGPTAEQVEAAAIEVGVIKPEEKEETVGESTEETSEDTGEKGEEESSTEKSEVELPAAAANGEGVAPRGETQTTARPAPVTVPDGWAELHWTQQVKLAEDLSGAEVVAAGGKTKVEVAKGIIEAHLAK